MHQTLLLNATYEPLTLINWQKALTLVILRKVEVLVHHEERVSSAKADHALPAVVRLIRRVAWRKLGIRFNRHNVYQRDRHQCQYCAKQFKAKDLTLDHVVPKSTGGPTSWTNIVTSCVPCNQRKADRTPEQAKMALLRKPYAPYWMQVSIPQRDDTGVSRLWKPYLWS